MQEHTHGTVSAEVCNSSCYQIRHPIAVEVPNGERPRVLNPVAYIQDHRRLERSITVSEYNCYVGVLQVNNCGIRFAVTIQVCCYDGDSTTSSSFVGRRDLEGAVAVSQEHTYAADTSELVTLGAVIGD